MPLSYPHSKGYQRVFQDVSHAVGIAINGWLEWHQLLAPHQYAEKSALHPCCLLRRQKINGPKKLNDLGLIAGRQKNLQYPRIVKAELKLLTQFSFHYQKHAKVLIAQYKGST